MKKWYVKQFDRNWVRCGNWKCRAIFLFMAVERKRKCPVCKMDNKHCLPEKKTQEAHP